jgi:hypothetical protein
MTETKHLPAPAQASYQIWLSPAQFCQNAVQSGFFREAGIQNEAQAIMKVAYGQALGLDPATSLMELYVVRGKVQMEPNAIATRFAMHPRYDCEITSLDDEQCTVQVTYDGKPKGDPVQFTFEMAKKAGWCFDRDGKLKTSWAVDRRQQLSYKAKVRAYRLYARDLTGPIPVGDIEEVQTETVSEAKEIAVLAAAGKRNRAKPEQVKVEVIESSEAPGGALASLTQQASENSPAPSEVSATNEKDLDRKVTSEEVVAGLKELKETGWTGSNLTAHIKQPLVKLSVAAFFDLIEWAKQNPRSEMNS